MSSVRWWTVRESRTRAVMLKRSSRFRGSFSSSPACHTQVDNVFKQCCGSRMFIPDPDFLPILDPGFQIPDLGYKNSNKRGGGRKFFVLPFLVAKNFTKLKITVFIRKGKKLEPMKLSSQKYRLWTRIRNPDYRICVFLYHRNPLAQIYQPLSILTYKNSLTIKTGN